MGIPIIKRQGSIKSIKTSEWILKILVCFLCMTIIVEFYFPESVISSSFSYLSVLMELLISLYILYSDHWVISINIEGLIAIIYLISSFCFTLMHAGYSSAIIAVFKEYFILCVCVFLRNRQYSMKGFNKVLKFIVAFAVLSLLVSIVNDNLIVKVIHITNVYEADIKSFFLGKNQFGRFMYLSTICTFFLFTYSSTKTKKLFYLCLSGIFSLATVVTFSRTSLLALGVFFVCYYFITSQNKIFKKLLIMAGLIIVACWIFSNDILINYINQYIIRKDVGIGSRSDIWAIGLKYISQHPIIGAGEYMAEKIINTGGINISEFHNAYIYRMVVSGIPIASLFIVILIKRFKIMIRNKKDNPIMNCSLAMLISLLIYMFLEQYTLFQFSITGFIVILFIYIAPNIIDFYKEA